MCGVWSTFCSLCGSLCQQNQPWIYVGGFWLIDIHSVDIIYNGIQFALNHSPNASESASTHERRTEKKKHEMKTKQEDSAALAICFIPAILFSRSPFFFRVSSYRSSQTPVSQYNALHEGEFKYKFWMDSFSESLQLQAVLWKKLIFLVLVRPSHVFFFLLRGVVRH